MNAAGWGYGEFPFPRPIWRPLPRKRNAKSSPTHGAPIPPRMTREQVAVKGIPCDADSDQPWRRLPETRHRPLAPRLRDDGLAAGPGWMSSVCPRAGKRGLIADRAVAGRFQEEDRAGPPHVGPMHDRPGAPRGQVRRRSRVRRCRRTPRRTRPLRLRRPKRRSSETHPSALACSDISLVSEILSELHDFRMAPGHPPGPASARWQRRARHGRPRSRAHGGDRRRGRPHPR